ncbi:MAG TPA: hypothetical protein PK024_04725, partial [Methanospirillum sp.]
MILELNGQVNADLMKAAIVGVTMDEEVLNCRVMVREDMLWWMPLADVRPEDLFMHFSTPHPSRILHQALSIPLEYRSGPLIRLILIHSTDPSY